MSVFQRVASAGGKQKFLDVNQEWGGRGGGGQVLPRSLGKKRGCRSRLEKINGDAREFSTAVLPAAEKGGGRKTIGKGGSANC